MSVFQYSDTALDYLKEKDKRLGEAIDQIGRIERTVHSDLFSALVDSIVGQQISTKAQQTIWKRMEERLGKVTPERILECPLEELQQFGISFRKASYIKDAADQVLNGTFEIEKLACLPDEKVCEELVKLKGVGVWTAEMLMIFSMQRQDILSYGDLAIHRGLRMLYHHRRITPALFEKYRRSYSPYGSVASLYLWAVAGGEIEGMKDYAPAGKTQKK